MTMKTLAAPRRWPSRTARVAERHPAPAEGVVLVADANEDSRAVYTAVLRHAGFHVLEADTGEEAIRLAVAWEPQAIVLSAVLRGVDGLRALEVLKDHRLTADIPVLVMDTRMDVEHERRARAAGCAAYLLKPCTPCQVMGEVLRVAGVPA